MRSAVVWRTPVFVEIAVSVLIFVVATSAGIRSVEAFRRAGGGEYFYQQEFGPALMMACHRGLENPDIRQAPAVSAFLLSATDSVDCADVRSLPTAAMSQFQLGSLYLEAAVGLTWRVTGVSWSRLVLLDGALFGAVAALTYGVLRLALGRAYALLCLVPSITATPNLMLVPQLRDYAKGPFLLGVILLMGALVVGRPHPRRTLMLSALGGIVIGIGLGFRTDVFVAVPPFLVTLALLLPAAVTIRQRLGAVAVFTVAFLAAALPVFRGYTQGGNTGHVILLGLAPDFDRTLRVEPSIYELLGLYNDSFGFSTINGYANRVENRPEGADLSTPDYDRAAFRYLVEIGERFPADLVTRAIAAIRVVPRYFLDSSLYPPIQLQSESAAGVYRWRNRIWWRLAPIAFGAVVAATFVAGVVDQRAAWLIVVVMAGFGATSAVQFHERHFYYLEFVPWLAFGILAQLFLSFRRSTAQVTAAQLKRSALVLGVVAAGVAALMLVTRAYQQRVVRALVDTYDRAPRTPLALEHRPAGAGRIRLTVNEWNQPMAAGTGRVLTRFLVLRLGGPQCRDMTLPLTLRYEATQQDADLSQDLSVSLGSGVAFTQLFVVVYDRANESIRFRGVELPAGSAACVAGVDRVDGLEHAPVLLTTVVAADWRQQRLYQTLR